MSQLSSSPPVETPAAAAAAVAPHNWWMSLAWFAALLGLSYAIVIYRLAEQWLTNDDMSHGVFVPILVGYIVWQRRHQLAAVPARPNRWGIVLLVLGGVMLCIGPPSLPTFVFITRVAFICSLIGTILYLRGTTTLLLLIYPFILLFFMIPIPGFIYERITLPLQFIASSLAEYMLEGLGFSVLRDGNILQLPGQTLSVVEACSGLRSLLSLSFLGQAYVYMFDQKVWMRYAVAIAILPIAVIANAGRIVFTAMLGTYNANWTHGLAHESTGWAVFLIAFLCLLVVHWGLNKLLDSSFLGKLRHV